MKPFKCLFLCCSMFNIFACSMLNKSQPVALVPVPTPPALTSGEAHCTACGYISRIEIITPPSSVAERGDAPVQNKKMLGDAGLLPASENVSGPEPSSWYRLTIDFDNGQQGQYDYPIVDQLRVGNRVNLKEGVIYPL